MKALLVLLSILSLAGCVSSAPIAYVAVANNALSGGMRIASIDGVSIDDTNGSELSVGEHKFGVACRLDNGISTTFSFTVDLEANHSYCFYAQDQGQSCKIAYSRVLWDDSGRVSCQ
jgi:hypothetical protein